MTGEKLERYLYGDCLLLALWLSEFTGWPMVQVIERDDCPGGWAARHALVRMPDGRLLDAAGPHGDYSDVDDEERPGWSFGDIEPFSRADWGADDEEWKGFGDVADDARSLLAEIGWPAWVATTRDENPARSPYHQPHQSHITTQEADQVTMSYVSAEICAGAGGCALGLEQAGFEPGVLVEIDGDCCATLRDNRPGWQVVQDDVTAGHLLGTFDLVSAGLPCTPHSRAGQQRGEDDERHLWHSALRIIGAASPRAVLLETSDAVMSAMFDIERAGTVGRLARGRLPGPVGGHRLLLVRRQPAP